MIDINFLWIDNKPLSLLEKLCLKSHVNNGHKCILWCYHNISVPDDVEQKDANTIVDSNKIFRYQKPPFKNNLAGFSDLFRYEILFRYGGWWCDLDVLCLKKFDFEQEYVFATERRLNKTIGIAPSVIKCPKNSDFIKQCLEEARSRLEINNNIDWGEIAHKLLNRNIGRHNLEKYKTKYNVFCPIGWFDAEVFFQPNKTIDLSSSYGIHLWNTCIKRKNINKNTPIKNSYFNYFMKINNVSVHQ